MLLLLPVKTATKILSTNCFTFGFPHALLGVVVVVVDVDCRCFFCLSFVVVVVVVVVGVVVIVECRRC